MLTHCYQQKKSNQFIDFIERVDSSYDLNIKRIFLVLDNASIHKSKKTKEALSKHHPRITLVFLPTKSPKLNVIEVRWMWLQRKAIDNSTVQKSFTVMTSLSISLKLRGVHFYHRRYYLSHALEIINIMRQQSFVYRVGVVFLACGEMADSIAHQRVMIYN